MSEQNHPFNLSELGLGKPTEYRSEYAPELLQAVPRALNRNELGISETLPFFGADIWQGYELSWLNVKGKPVVRLLRCSVPYSSPNLIESKSFKLYLNSFNQSHFVSELEVSKRLTKDLSLIAGTDVEIDLFSPSDNDAFQQQDLPGQCIDELDIDIRAYQLDTSYLKTDAAKQTEFKSEIVHSHLLKSNCLITNQPDWASVVIDYSGQAVGHEALLRYLISFRMHNEFHEQCVERMFTDLMAVYKLDSLSVQALYTRRGGLDINPFRTTNPELSAPYRRVNRQ